MNRQYSRYGLSLSPHMDISMDIRTLRRTILQIEEESRTLYRLYLV